MAQDALTRAALAEAVYQQVGLSRNESAQLVEVILSEITKTLTRGEAVKISSFGSWLVRQKNEREGRNPKTGEPATITPRKVVVFRPSQILKKVVNGEKITLADHSGEDDH